jgi:DNA-binding SARP family transcriptional activator
VTLRIFLAGEVVVEHDGRILAEHRLPGLQGRVVLAMLVAERERPVSRDEVAEELWSASPPPTWEPAIRALVSKLRGSLVDVGLERDALAGAFGSYQLRLPADSWVDIEAAADALHRGETSARAGAIEDGCGWALAARAIAGRPLLPGADGPWVARRRERLRAVHLRSLELLANLWVDRGEPSLAVGDAEQALRLEPFRESAYRALMRAHVRAGNRAEALRAYEQCRTLLAGDLGIDPSTETEALYLEILRTS